MKYINDFKITLARHSENVYTYVKESQTTVILKLKLQYFNR